MQRYSTDIPETASELFDGELVIADYGSGLYYSISESGALVWQGLRSGLADTEIVDMLATRYGSTAGTIAALVADFIARMLSEGLLRPVDEVAAAPFILPETVSATFDPPSLERFEDLQELLLLDPVHDVDQTGWPRRAVDQP